jgi:hypothetical protein
MKPTSDWRSRIKVHPAADLFPMMSPEELKALGEDIKANGLRMPIETWFDEKAEEEWLIDGRNRLDALASLGYHFVRRETRCGEWTRHEHLIIHEPTGRKTVQVRQHGGDPYTLAISFNINRRHLTTQQKGELIAALLKAEPERSDRATAAIAKTSPQTVTKVRKDLEATAQIEQLDKRTGKDGKTRKSRKATLQPLVDKADVLAATGIVFPVVKVAGQFIAEDDKAVAEALLAEADTVAETGPAADYPRAYLAPNVDKRTLPAYNFPEPSEKDCDAWIETYLSWPLHIRLTMRQILFNLSDTAIPENPTGPAQADAAE